MVLTPARAELVIDPVCRMLVDTASPHLVVRDDETYHFCSRTCLEVFAELAVPAEPR